MIAKLKKNLLQLNFCWIKRWRIKWAKKQEQTSINEQGILRDTVIINRFRIIAN